VGAQVESQDPVVCHYDYDFLDETETQAEGQNCLSEMAYHYGYDYCDTHQSQSYQDNVGGESVPAQPSDHVQVSQAESPCVILQFNNITKNKMHLHQD
jgi:hypothetical protein